MRTGAGTKIITNGMVAVGKNHHIRDIDTAVVIGANHLKATDGMRAAGTAKKCFSYMVINTNSHDRGFYRGYFFQ